MQKRRFEKVAVMLLSVIMLLTSTGIVSSLASNVVNESSSAPVYSATESSTQATSAETSSSSSSAETSAEEATPIAGTGTKENPFKISALEELLAVRTRASAEETYFVLQNDIDLSSVAAADFVGGSLLGLNANAAVIFDGNGFSLKGLNVELAEGTSASIFGVIGEKSVVKNLKIQKPRLKSNSADMKSIAIVAAENKGAISGVTITYPVLTAAKADYAAFIAAVNMGSISNAAVTASHTNISAASADNHTISSQGVAGAIAGLNRGTVANASAINIGMYIPESEIAAVYGGIAGLNSGSVLNSVSTGNVVGGKAADIVGGIVGKAIAQEGGKDAASVLTNNYTLVTVPNTVSGCAVIGAGGNAQMMTDCFWSSAVSGRNVSADDFGAGVGELATEFKLIPEGKSVSLSAADVKSTSWGKAIFELDGEIKIKGDGFSSVTEDGIVTVKAEACGKVAYASYMAKLMLPANVGAASAQKTLKQYVRVALICVAADAKGDGTAENPFVIKNSSDFALYRYAPRMNAVLGGDIKASTVPAIKGTFNGNGYTVTVSKPLVSAVYGEVKNVNISVSSNIASAVLGNAIGAKISGVSVKMADGAALEAAESGRGILFNAVSGVSVIDDCRVQGSVIVKADKISDVGGFAGLVNGDGAAITNSGAVVNISAQDGFTAQNIAAFAGKISGDDVKLVSCYVGGENLAGEFMFLSDISGKNIKVENIKTAFGEAIALDFEKYVDVNENQFKEWAFDNGSVGFFTGNGGSFEITLPALKAFENAKAEDFSVVCDEKVLAGSVSLKGDKITLSVERAKGVITVKALPVKLIHVNTGLSAQIHISNGLEKDSLGRYVISTAYDLAYVSENISELHSAEFIMSNDVDMAVLDTFAPIGGADIAFSGTFNGNGKVIKNLSVDGAAKAGLFGVLNGAKVTDITFKNAEVSAKGGYVGVLAGQVTGKATVSGVAVDGAKVTSSDLYAGVVFGAIDGNESGLSVSAVSVKNSSVESEANYVGAVAGIVRGSAAISDMSVESFKASGASYVGGIAGLLKGESSITLEGVYVSDAEISGVSEVSGVASGNEKVIIRDAHVKASAVSTVSLSSANSAGGISAVFGMLISDSSVESTRISAGVAGGIVGKTSADCNLTIKASSVSACEITSAGANTVAAGILGVHNVKGIASVENAVVDADTVVGGAAVNAGLVGDCSSIDSGLLLYASKTLAAVNGSADANAIASAAALGRIGVSAVNNVKINGLKVGGSVNGGGELGGIVGSISGGKAYDAYGTIINDCIVFADIDSENANNAGMIIGGLRDDKLFAEDTVDMAVQNVTITTFCGVSAYGSSVLSGGYVDMDASVSANPSALATRDETTVQISGLPEIDGFVFDSAAGWVSESNDRIQVISSDEKSAVLQAQRRADVAIVGYYILESDSDVRVPVHFRMVSSVNEPLNGSGTESDPYLINNAYDLESMAGYADKGAYFALTTDIVLTEADFEFGGAFYNVGNGMVTIGDAYNAFNGTFTGLYNGTVHSITGLRMQGNTFGGLFGATDGAVITDLAINDADISANAYGGVLVGRANSTVIRNVTVNSSSVESISFGSFVGGVVGGAESTNIENVTLNDINVTTTLDASAATVEYAGGVAGAFGGTVKNVNLSSASVQSDAVAGGVIGIANGSSAYVMNCVADAQVQAEIAGGVAGQVSDTLGFGVSDVHVSGSVYGKEIAAGVAAQVLAESANSSFAKLNRSFVSETVITAKISGDGTRAVVIAEVSEAVAEDCANENAEIFENIYYSSYQNPFGAFGAEVFNAYQNGEYDIIDLSEISYIADGVSSNAIPLGKEFTALSEENVILGGGEGSFKAFNAGGRAFELIDVTSDVEGLVAYDAETSSVKLNSELTENAKLVFCYNSGLELAVNISAESSESNENAVLIKCGIVNATGNAEISSKLAAVMLKTKDGETVKSADFFTTADAAERTIGALEIADGALFVNMHLPEGCEFSVNAADENGNALETKTADGDGIVVSAGSATEISLSIAVENEKESAWGLRSIWSPVEK